jgi:hypothetical protein
MEINKILAGQFAATSREKNWLASLRSALEGLNAKQAMWKTEFVDHSILQLVNHLYYWNERHLQRLKGITPEEMVSDNTITFESEHPELTDDSWKLLVEKVNAMMDEFEKEILNCDDAKLKSSVSNQNKMTWLSLFSNTNLHNAYHIGQIVLIRKMQESWDAGNGVS